MLPFEIAGTRGPWVVMLHWLGGSGRTWTELSQRLAARGMRCVRVDLPGFGAAVDVAGYDVDAMAAAVVETVRGLHMGDAPWLLAGHSMGGKVAAVVARAAVDEVTGLEGLRGLVMVSPSPPGTEPMKESKRAEMLESLGQPTGDAKEDRKRARKFVTGNVGKLTLPEALEDRAIDDVLRMNRGAFRAWLQDGSREDWGPRVGVLTLPALVFAGSEESALGPTSERQHLLPHLPNAKLVTLAGAGHLGVLERVDEIAEEVVSFVESLGLPLEPETMQLGVEFERLMMSERTSAKTREVMLQRLATTVSENVQDDHQAFPEAARRTLRVLVECVLPNAGFDLAARVEALLASGTTDGTRSDALPVDSEAWRIGLRSLDAAAQQEFATSFLALDAARRTEMLQKAADGKLGRGMVNGLLHAAGLADEVFSAAAMKLWFEEVRGIVTRLFVADPRTMERIGFAGFADDPHGFTQIRLGEMEGRLQ